MAHIPLTLRDAYRPYVFAMQNAHGDQRGFVPIDNVILNQPLSQMLHARVMQTANLNDEDKLAHRVPRFAA